MQRNKNVDVMKFNYCVLWRLFVARSAAGGKACTLAVSKTEKYSRTQHPMTL